MKPSSAVIALIVALTAARFPTPLDAGSPVTFDLSVDPAGVALQFDVTSDQPLARMGLPDFEGASEHSVRSSTIAGGAHRFVVYSLDGEPISDTGSVTVHFPGAFAFADGAIAIENVTASNASGETVSAEPNALPALRLTAKSHQSLDAGSTVAFERPAVDLDGSIAQLTLQADGNDVDTATAVPFLLEWGPVSSGTYTLRLFATDNRNSAVPFDLGAYRAFSPGEINSFASYSSIHYGDSAPASEAGFSADPLGNGFPNGLAYLLGLNPHAPDFRRLPRVTLDSSPEGDALVVRFLRRSEATDVIWSARSSNDLSLFETLPADLTTETDQGDGSHAVEIRVPIESSDGYRQFIDIGVEQP